MPRFSAARAVLAAVFALPLSLLAQAPSPDVAAAAPASPPAPGQPFQLQDAIALALKKNFDLQLQAYSAESAKENINIARGDFDPNLTASASRSISQAASTTSRLEGTSLEGPRSDNTSLRVGASEKLAPTNGTLGLSTNLSRSASNSSNNFFNPSFGNGVSATLSQPLLKGFGRTVATSTLEKSKLGLDIATLGYKSRVLTVIRDTENAYYNLVAARETLRIRQLTLTYNQTLLQENQARRSTGVATDLDVATAEYGVANARRGVVQAQQGVADAEDALMSLINVPDFNVRLGPVAFQDFNESAPAFATSYKLARDYYPDTLSAQDTIKQLEIDLAVAKRNRLPAVNLDASLGYNARATDQSYGDAIGNLPHDHGNNWSLGLSYSEPWGRRADKARYRSAVISLNSQKLRLEQLEQSLLLQVRSAVRGVDSNIEGVQIAAQATALSAKQYDLQKARFDAGLSTSRLVLQAQDDLETARFNELSAKVSLWRAVAELHRLEGSSLQRFGVQLP
jgi:outer membrane protein